MSINKGTLFEEEKIYVAVSNDIRQNRSLLKWALGSSRGKKLCTLHVRRPANKTNYDSEEEEEVISSKTAPDGLNEHFGIALKSEMFMEKLSIEADSIEKGIIQLVEEHNIRELVIGAAADEHYSRRTAEVKSKKAMYVRDNAPAFCQIWFVCNGNLIDTRGAINPPEASPCKDAHVPAEKDGGTGRQTASDGSVSLPGSALKFSAGHLPRNSSLGIESENSVIDRKIYDQFDHAMIEAETSSRVAFEDSIRRLKAEKEAMSNALRKVETTERMYREELKRRKEMEEVLAKRNEELATLNEQLDLNNELWSNASHKISETMDQKRALENLIEKSSIFEKESEKKLISAVELLQKYKNECEDLETERNNAVKEAEKLRQQLGKGQPSSRVPIFVSVLCSSDLEKATNHFDPLYKIVDREKSVRMYKGFLRQTPVLIKIINPHIPKIRRAFDQEVNISRLRHPNLVTLIGMCPKSFALVYEYLPGTLEDRFSNKDNAPPLPWQTRIRIAMELCSALIFLHSSRPGHIHGNLKPSNVLLDDNCVCKLRNYGICHVVSNDKAPIDQTTVFFATELDGSTMYRDHEFLKDGVLTLKTDVYALGIILLQLLTGKSPVAIIHIVKSALAEDTFESMLDPSAGDWPYVEAKQLAHMALRCCDRKPENRPNLEFEVWRDLAALQHKKTNLLKQ